MADYFPLLSRTIASLGNSTPEQRQIVYERARSVVADQLSAIEPPMDSDAIRRELSLFEASVMRLEHEMKSLEAIKPPQLPGENETRKHISARLSALLAKAAAARAATTQDLLTRDIEPSDRAEGDQSAASDPAPASHVTPRVTVERVPGPVSRSGSRPSASSGPLVVDRKPAMPVITDLPKWDDGLVEAKKPETKQPEDKPSEVLPDDGQATDAAVTGDHTPNPLDETAEASPPLDDDRVALLADAPRALLEEGAPPSPVKADEPVLPAPVAVQDTAVARRGSLSQLVLKLQGFLNKTVPPAAKTPPETAISDAVLSDAPQDDAQASLFVQEPVASPVASPVLAVGEPPQPALPLVVADKDFVGPVLPIEEPAELSGDDHAHEPAAASTDIVFSDDAAQAQEPDDAQGELPFLSPPKPAPASEIELLDDGRPRLAQRRKRDRGLFRGLVMGLAFVSVIAAVAGTAWVLRDRPADFEQGSTATRGDLSRKISDRLPSEAVVVSTQTGEPLAAGGAGVAASGQRVMLFEEGVEGQPEPVPVKGRVTWALETIRDQTGAGDVAIKAEIRDLSGSLSAVTLVIKRNRDIGFPASHLIELTFATPDNSPNGRVRDIGTPEMRAEEGVRGTSLSGLPVPVTENVFLVGLTNLPDRIEQNRDLLRNRNWIVIPMRFANGRRAVMMVEKGLVGDRVLLDAFQAWK